LKTLGGKAWAFVGEERRTRAQPAPAQARTGRRVMVKRPRTKQQSASAAGSVTRAYTSGECSVRGRCGGLPSSRPAATAAPRRAGAQRPCRRAHARPGCGTRRAGAAALALKLALALT
jgi:hypothetical protein